MLSKKRFNHILIKALSHVLVGAKAQMGFRRSVSINMPPLSISRFIVPYQQATDGQYNLVEDYSRSDNAGLSVLHMNKVTAIVEGNVSEKSTQLKASLYTGWLLLIKQMRIQSWYAEKICSYSLSMYLLLLLFSCSTPKESKDDILWIDLQKAEKRSYLDASEVISNIEYVALETNSQCIVGEPVVISVSENYILSFSGSNCHLFSRNGHFIRTIGQRGNGPQDYIGDFYNVKIDEKSGMVYLMGVLNILAYRLSGDFFMKLNIRDLVKNFGISIPLNIKHWKENLFFANFNLGSVNEPYRFIIFSLEGEIVKLFSNNNIFFETDGKLPFSSIYTDVNIYSFNEQLYFKEILCDTLFRISEQLDLVPEIIFDTHDKKTLTNMLRFYYSSTPEYYAITKIYELENYMLLFDSAPFKFKYFLYEKNNNRLFSFEHELLFEHEQISHILGSTSSRTFRLPGLSNDIDGGLPIMPDFFNNIQNNQQIVTVYQSYLLKGQLTEKHFERVKIKDQEAHKRLRNLLSNLDEEDNPVLMIATFK